MIPDAPLPDGWRHGYTANNAVRLHYVEAGQGPLVILLHGFPEFWYAWRHQIPALQAAGFRVIALDQRGYNTSDKPKGVGNYRVESLVNDVVDVIHEAGEESAVVVGHDWGGAIAWVLAMQHPEAVRKLIVLNAPHPQRLFEEMRTFAQIRRSWYMFLFQVPWLPEQLLRAWNYRSLAVALRRDPIHPGAFGAADIAAYRQAMAQPGALTATINYYRALFRRNPLKLLREIRRIDTPTLLIWAEQDRYLGVRLAQGLEPWVPNITIERIPDASHWVQAEVPERVNRLMVKFLAASNFSVPPSSGGR